MILIERGSPVGLNPGRRTVGAQHAVLDGEAVTALRGRLHGGLDGDQVVGVDAVEQAVGFGAGCTRIDPEEKGCLVVRAQFAPFDIKLPNAHSRRLQGELRAGRVTWIRNHELVHQTRGSLGTPVHFVEMAMCLSTSECGPTRLINGFIAEVSDGLRPVAGSGTGLRRDLLDKPSPQPHDLLRWTGDEEEAAAGVGLDSLQQLHVSLG